MALLSSPDPRGRREVLLAGIRELAVEFRTVLMPSDPATSTAEVSHIVGGGPIPVRVAR